MQKSKTMQWNDAVHIFDIHRSSCTFTSTGSMCPEHFWHFVLPKKIFMNWNIATWWLGWKPQWCWEQQILNYFKMLNERFKRIENKNVSRDFLWKKRCSWDSFSLSTVRHFIISKCLQFNRSPLLLMPLHLKIDGKCGVCLHTIWKMAASKAF